MMITPSEFEQVFFTTFSQIIFIKISQVAKICNRQDVQTYHVWILPFTRNSFREVAKGVFEVVVIKLVKMKSDGKEGQKQIDSHSCE